MTDYKVVGMDAFDSKDTKIIDALTKKYCQKLSRHFPEALLVLDAKKHEKGGKVHHYSFHVKMDNPSFVTKVKGDDWDLNRCLHKLFDTLDFKLQHTFHLEGHDERHRI